MDEPFPIAPPPELVQQWIKQCNDPVKPRWQEYEQDIANLAAQWGADMELEACKQWLSLRGHAELAIKLGYCMRNKPEPPSLKEQALEALEDANLDAAHYNIILRALEALPND